MYLRKLGLLRSIRLRYSSLVAFTDIASYCPAAPAIRVEVAAQPGQRDAEEELNNPNITTYDVIDGLKNGDAVMTKIFTRWQNDITAGIIGLANLFDPDCFVLSGSMAQFIDIKKVEADVNREIVTSPTSIRLAAAGNYSGMAGAALLALEKFKSVNSESK